MCGFASCHEIAPCKFRFATLHHYVICITPLVNQALKQHRLCSANKQSNSFLVNPHLSVIGSGKNHSIAADRRDYTILSHTEKDIFSICNRQPLHVTCCVSSVHVLVHETAAGTPHSQRLQRQSGRPAGVRHHQRTGTCASEHVIDVEYIKEIVHSKQ